MYCGSLFYSSKQTRLVGVIRPVCKQCAYMAEADVLAIRQKRTECELREKDKGMRNCWKCTRELGGGVRWWISDCCGLECRAVCHSAWRGKEKGGKDEVVGEEAV
jgi:hypothetical protein